MTTIPALEILEGGITKRKKKTRNILFIIHFIIFSNLLSLGKSKDQK